MAFTVPITSRGPDLKDALVCEGRTTSDFSLYPPIYVEVFQVVSSFQVFRLKRWYMHFSSVITFSQVMKLFTTYFSPFSSFFLSLSGSNNLLSVLPSNIFPLR